MSFTENAQMNCKTLLSVAQALPGNISVLLRANHGVGKSQIVRQIHDLIVVADGVHREFIDRRLSQMSEGDMIGLPSTNGEVTRFNPPDWYRRACDAPCTLFLDELNRATPEVMQAAFQIVLDRELNGWKLHPDTRVYAAINTAASYTVNEMDPALLDRFFVVDLDISVDEWLEWAAKSETMSPIVVDWIRSNRAFADPAPGGAAGSVQPSRRSLERLSLAYKAAKVTPKSPLFYTLALGFLGLEGAQSLAAWAKNNDNNIEPGEALEDWQGLCAKKFKRLGIDEQLNVIVKVTEELVRRGEAATDNNVAQVAAMADDAHPEHFPQVFSIVGKAQDNKKMLLRFNATGYTKKLAELYRPAINAAINKDKK